jgi:hypothetical protein
MMINYEAIALEFARKLGYDSIRKAGEKDGNMYFHIFWKNSPRYVGCHYIKVTPDGTCLRLEDFTEEWHWASHQEVLLNNF